MGQPRPLFHLFSSFQTHIQNFTSMWKKCPSSIWCRDSNSRPLEHEYPPIITRPGLPPYLWGQQELPHFSLIRQIHFVNSLLNGRLIYDERKNRFQTLAPFLIFIEGTWNFGGDLDAIRKANEEFFGQMVTIVMKKSPDSDVAILNKVWINCLRWFS